jgi:uncharacterized membrane-anchored protein
MKLKNTLLICAILFSPRVALADEVAQAAALKKAWEAVEKVVKVGPTEVALVDQAVLKLPDKMVFVPKAEANELLNAWGNSFDDRLLGMVMPTEGSNWAATIDQTQEGYVKDEEARNWDADALLANLKEGTEAQNEDRIARGFDPLEVTGWIEKPSYDSPSHRLVWSMRMAHKGAVAGEDATVNFNTYALGKDGYLEIDLLTSEKTIAKDKTYARQILSAIDYNPGKRYEDFKLGTDHLAEYGIAALIGGVVAKKLGFLALASVFILKFIKIIGVAVVVGIAGIKRFFFGKKPEDV